MKAKDLLTLIEDDREVPYGWEIPKGEDPFNKLGDKPYRLRFETTRGDYDKPKYYLAILLHDKGHYLAAHGGVIIPGKYKTALQAADAALEWYYSNREE